MTTPDNSPSLGGQSDDLSPMISSSATRAIANPDRTVHINALKSLLARAEETRQFRFGQAVIMQALYYICQIEVLLAATPAYARMINAVREWVEMPSEGSTLRVQKLFDSSLGWQTRISQTNWRFVGKGVPAEALTAIVHNTTSSVIHTHWHNYVRPATKTVHTVRYVTAILTDGPLAVVEREALRACAWQIEAAHAIVDHMPLPSLEPES